MTIESVAVISEKDREIKRVALTKKQRKAFARALIDLYPYGKSFSKKDAAVFWWLTGLEAANVVKMPNPEFPNDPRHVTLDGKATSWVRAIEGWSEEQSLKRTMRLIISKDLREYLSCQEPCECANCGATEDLTTDHADLPFDTIAENFIREFGPVETDDKENGVGNKFVDLDLEAKWIAYHAANATYQILCRSCNASKGKRVNTTEDNEKPINTVSLPWLKAS